MEQPQQLAAGFRLQNVQVGEHEVIAEDALRLVVDHVCRKDLRPAPTTRYDKRHEDRGNKVGCFCVTPEGWSTLGPAPFV